MISEVKKTSIIGNRDRENKFIQYVLVDVYLKDENSRKQTKIKTGKFLANNNNNEHKSVSVVILFVCLFTIILLSFNHQCFFWAHLMMQNEEEEKNHTHRDTQ